ncbi:hypothetical protein D3C71_1390740 [compost metagenome]
MLDANAAVIESDSLCDLALQFFNCGHVVEHCVVELDDGAFVGPGAAVHVGGMVTAVQLIGHHVAGAVERQTVGQPGGALERRGRRVQEGRLDVAGLAVEVVAQGYGVVQRVDAGVGEGGQGCVGDAVLVQQDDQGHRGLVAVERGSCVVAGLQHAVPAAQHLRQGAGARIGGDGGVMPGQRHGSGQQTGQVVVQRLDQGVGGKLLECLGVIGSGHPAIIALLNGESVTDKQCSGNDLGARERGLAHLLRPGLRRLSCAMFHHRGCDPEGGCDWDAG